MARSTRCRHSSNRMDRCASCASQGPNGPDRGVHDLFATAGRNDAPAGSQIQQPDFSNANNLSFRIPAPTFGLGLIEVVPDSTLRANLAANAILKRQLGIQGRGIQRRDGGEQRAFPAGAGGQPGLRDHAIAGFGGRPGSGRLLRHREPGVFHAVPGATPTRAGRCLDRQRTRAVRTSRMRVVSHPEPANRQRIVGRAAAAGGGSVLRPGAASHGAIAQRRHYARRSAGQDWRTAPLWGLGDRLFLLHDGRTKDLLQAILQHDSPGSEAHGTVVNFQGLGASQKQDVLNFLRSL